MQCRLDEILSKLKSYTNILISILMFLIPNYSYPLQIKHCNKTNGFKWQYFQKILIPDITNLTWIFSCKSVSRALSVWSEIRYQLNPFL